MTRRLAAAFALTDRTRPLTEGRVAVEGFALDVTIGEPQELFRIALREKRFEVTEMSVGSQFLVTARGEAAYVGIPVFLSRAFRHNAIYVRADRGIEAPADLNGRAIGVPEYQQTAALWVRGMLGSHYGVDLGSILWRTGGLDEAGQDERIALGDIPGRRIVPIGPEQTLSAMLAEGEIDAIISPRPPSCFGKPDVPARRLFADTLSAEKDYFRATGHFPIMHCLAIRRDVAEQHPELPGRLLQAFTQAKALALKDLSLTNYYRVCLPWVAEHVAAVQAEMGSDPWRYGFEANRAELEAMADYAVADGLTARRVAPQELFHPSTLR